MKHWRLTFTDSTGEAWTDEHDRLVRVIIDGQVMERRPIRAGRTRGLDAIRTIADLERLGVVVDQEI